MTESEEPQDRETRNAAPARKLGAVSTVNLAELAGFSERAAAQVSEAVAAAAKVDMRWVRPVTNWIAPTLTPEPSPIAERLPELLDPALLQPRIDPVHHEIADAAQAQVDRLDAMAELMKRQVLAQSTMLDVQRTALEQSAKSQQQATRLTRLGLAIAVVAVVVSLPSTVATVVALIG